MSSLRGQVSDVPDAPDRSNLVCLEQAQHRERPDPVNLENGNAQQAGIGRILEGADGKFVVHTRLLSGRVTA